MDSAVVLGGTGFVGQHVAAALASAGSAVTVVARRPPTGDTPHRVVCADLTETTPESLADLLRPHQPTMVVEAVGSSWGLTDAQMPDRCTAPVTRLLAALDLLPRRPRLVHLGSVLEFGPTPPGTSTDDRSKARPHTAYGRAKLAATSHVLRSATVYGHSAVVLRVANAVGPGAPAASLLGGVADQLCRADRVTGRPEVALPPVHGYRDYVDVRDVADAVVAAAVSAVSGRAIPIGRGEAVPVSGLVDLLIEVSGVSATVTTQPTDQTGWRTRTSWLRVDPEPAARLLGWRPRVPMTNSIRDLWQERRARLSPGLPGPRAEVHHP